MIKQYLEQHKEELKPWLEGGEQGRVEIKILPYLQDIENGVFIEAGALDGLFMSNTKILEDLGWLGLLVEPSRKAAKACRENRKSIVEEYALVSYDFKEEHVLGDFLFDGEAGVGAWSSINRQFYGYRVGNTFTPMGIYVKARTLQSLLDEHKITHVDFFSLDVEGYELEVLKGVDFAKTDITYILIEINLSDYKLEDMDAYLAQFGYKDLGCLSGFSDKMKGWSGEHNDYLYAKS